MEQPKKFTMIDEPFKCLVCGKEVKPLNYTARDHCPYCLTSLHVDNNPGDRLANCHGILEPFAVEKFKTDKFKIVYRCQKCHQLKKNVNAIDDNIDLIIDIMTKANMY